MAGQLAPEPRVTVWLLRGDCHSETCTRPHRHPPREGGDLFAQLKLQKGKEAVTGNFWAWLWFAAFLFVYIFSF